MSHTITLRDLREITGLPAHALNHALDRFGPAPSGRIGITRVWRRSDLPAIRESLAKIAAHPRQPGTPKGGWQVSVFTVPEVAEQLRVDRHKVAAWIASGELVARNVATSTSKRPIWRITAADLAAFLESRAAIPQVASPARRRQRKETYREFV